MLENISGLSQNKDISPILGEKAKPKTLNAQNKLSANSMKNNSSSQTKKIILASKGEAGYNPTFDTNGDGIITFDEFNEYCAENEISEEDKLKLLSVMQSAKTIEQLQEKSKSTDDEQKPIEKTKSIYAKKGDRKYDERMDENKDSIVTYEEYEKYCSEIKDKVKEKEEENSSAPSTPEEKEAQKAYKKDEIDPEISVETEA